MVIRPLAISILSLTLGCADAIGETVTHPSLSPMINHIYVGIFGGGGYANSRNFRQQGTDFYEISEGGPLLINAQGSADRNSSGVGGVHLGYKGPEWFPSKERSQWSIVPAAELEGYYLGVTSTGHLLNPTTRFAEHMFVDSFPINTGIFLANAVFTLNPYYMNRIHPYVGVGLGTAIVSISGANSAQVNPAEPGINYFNSNPNASDWTIAAQAKTGIQFDAADHWKVFAEYRYLYLAPTEYSFGSTQYSTQVPTSNWTVNFASLCGVLGSVGIEYKFDHA